MTATLTAPALTAEEQDLPFTPFFLNEHVVILGIDRDGFRVATSDGFLWYPTDCCDASAKGSEWGVVCRNCYNDVDSFYGGMPRLRDIVTQYDPATYEAPVFA